MKKIFIDSIPGALLGLWVVLHLWLVWILLNSTFTLPYEKSVTIKKSLYWSLTYIINNYALEAYELTLAIIIGGMALSAIWFFIDRKFHFDPCLLSTDSIKWSLRVVLKPATALTLIMPLVVMVFAYIINNFWLLYVPTIISILLAIFILPFSILGVSVLRSDTGENWWVPKWPGIWPVVSILLLLISSILLEIIFTIMISAFSSVGNGWLKPIDKLTPILSMFVPELYTSALAAVLIHKLSPKIAISKVKHVITWRILGPILALQIKLAYYFSFIAVPVISLAVIFVFVAPTYGRWLTDHGDDLPKYVKYAISCATFVQQTSGGSLVIPIVVIGLLLSGRLVWLLSNQSCDEQLPNNSVDHDAANPAAQVTL